MSQAVQGSLVPGVPDQPVGEPTYHVSYAVGQALVIWDDDAPDDLRAYMLQLVEGVAAAMVDAPFTNSEPTPGLPIEGDVVAAESRGRQKAKQARAQRPVAAPAPKPATPAVPRGRGGPSPRPKGPCMKCKTDSWVENGRGGWQCGKCLPPKTAP